MHWYCAAHFYWRTLWKISNSSIWYLYMCCQMNFAEDPANAPSPQFVGFGISNINALDKGASLWTPATRFLSPTDVAHWSAPDHIFWKIKAVGDSVSAKSDYNYKADFKTWSGNQEFERQNNTRSRQPLDSNLVGAKTSYPKTIAADLSKRK